jgi:hypothetical protein
MRILALCLLGLGVVAGFGSAFHHARHHGCGSEHGWGHAHRRSHDHFGGRAEPAPEGPDIDDAPSTPK